MSVSVRCDQCHEQYAVPDEWAGRRAKCKKCGHLLEIPVPAAPAPAVNPLTDLLDEALGAEITDGDAMGDPFAAAPPAEGASSGPLKPLPSKRRRPSGEPTFGGMLAAFGRSQKLITAVIVGMCWVFVCMLYDLVASGPGPAQIVSGVFLVVGVVIVGGGLQAGTPRRNRSNDKLWAGRAVAWMIGGIMGIVCSFGVAVAVGRMGWMTNVVSLTHLLTPFIIVFGLVTLISGLLLTYYVLVLLFPKTNIFRIAGWGYVGLTVVIPIMLLTLGMMLKVAVKTLDQPSSFPSSSNGSGVSDRFERPTRLTPGGAVGSSSRPKGFDSWRKGLVDTYGAERVVTVEISNLPLQDFGPAIAKMQTATHLREFFPMPTDSGAIIAAAPVDDIHAFAKKLDVGKVTGIDVIKRTITIEADGSY